MSIGDIVAVDLPVIIVLIVLWLLDYFGIKKVQKTLDEIRSRMRPPQ